MATEFVLPVLGDGVDGGTLVNYLVKEGDTVTEGQNVLELETDKAVMEVPVDASGTVKALLAKPNSKVKVGEAILTLDAAEAPKEAAPAPAAQPEPVKEEAPAPAAPVETTPVAAAPEHKNGTAPKAAPAPVSAPPAADGSRTPVPASPSVRRLAREIGVDVYEVAGSGPGGRIGEGDIKSHARNLLQNGGGTSGGVSAAPLPDFSKWGETENEPFSNVRRATANQMARAWQAPHVTQFDKADITAAEAFRKKYAKQAEKQGGKLTVTAILIKVIVAALKKYPQFNASLDLANDRIVLKKYYNVGVAVDTERGLLVPVIKDADKKGVFEIAAELGQIAERARNKKTSLEEMQGGCFTLTNLGGIGGTQFTPIVNVPEVAILGVARGGFEPVWNEETGQFEPRQMLPLCLSYDHRVIDGADGARFLRYIAQGLEDPFLLALDS